MHLTISSLLVAAFAPAAVLSLSLAEVDSLPKDTSAHCARTYGKQLQSCDNLKMGGQGSCSSSCAAELQSLSSYVILACPYTGGNQKVNNLLKEIYNGNLVHSLCGDIGYKGAGGGGTLIVKPTATAQFSGVSSPSATDGAKLEIAAASTGSSEKPSSLPSELHIPTMNTEEFAAVPSPNSEALSVPPTSPPSSSSSSTSSFSNSRSGPSDANGSLFGSTENQQSSSASKNMIAGWVFAISALTTLL